MPGIRVALVQFDARPEDVDGNLDKMHAFVRQARDRGARWIIFHEGTVSDYTEHLQEYAEPVPGGRSTSSIIALAREQDCFISFGLSEIDDERFYISQVFVGPQGLVHGYRKTWIWSDPTDTGYRNEWALYDPGTGPELFEFDGIKATCFVCSDGEAPRCIERARALGPQVVFYPNNRRNMPDFDELGALTQEIGAPMLACNRTGMSWDHACSGGSVVYSSSGSVLARANREGREEVLVCDVDLFFRFDVTICPACGGPMKGVAALTEPRSIARYLEGVGLPSRAPPIAPARPHPQPELDFAA